MKKINLNNFTISNSDPFCLICGPCVIENRDHTILMAESIKNICDELNINFIFKASFDKANRSNYQSVRGLGIEKSLEIFSEVKELFSCPIITDVHNENQCDLISKNNIVDIIQIPAFLSRQTDLLISAGKTNKIINIKKGQFMSVDSMKYAVNKVVESGNKKVMITERGTQFGYNDLIVDFRGISELKKIAPTILDVTHSVQKTNQTSGVTGGNPEYIESLARAGIVNGVDGIFIETHTDPSKAKSDGANMLDLNKLEDLLSNLLAIKLATSKL